MTSRLHLVDMPTHLGLAYVPLDGIGCTFALVKAHVHREGVTFPTFVFDNEVRASSFLPLQCLLCDHYPRNHMRVLRVREVPLHADTC